MFNTYALPGTYNFQGEIKMIISWFKEQLDIVLKEIESKEKLLDEH